MKPVPFFYLTCTVLPRMLSSDKTISLSSRLGSCDFEPVLDFCLSAQELYCHEQKFLFQCWKAQREGKKSVNFLVYCWCRNSSFNKKQENVSNFRNGYFGCLYSVIPLCSKNVLVVHISWMMKRIFVSSVSLLVLGAFLPQTNFYKLFIMSCEFQWIQLRLHGWILV